MAKTRNTVLNEIFMVIQQTWNCNSKMRCDVHVMCILFFKNRSHCACTVQWDQFEKCILNVLLTKVSLENKRIFFFGVLSGWQRKNDVLHRLTTIFYTDLFPPNNPWDDTWRVHDSNLVLNKRDLFSINSTVYRDVVAKLLFCCTWFFVHHNFGYRVYQDTYQKQRNDKMLGYKLEDWKTS